MKKSSHIISILKSQDEFKRLSQCSEIALFRAMAFTPPMQKQILFAIVKNDKLLIAARHPAFCQDLNYTKNILLSAIRQNEHKFPTLSQISTIQAYVPTHIFNPPPPPQMPEDRRFAELSKAEFENKCTDPDLKEIFEKIRKNIRDINEN